jgi:hypothetical protein
MIYMRVGEEDPRTGTRLTLKESDGNGKGTEKVDAFIVTDQMSGEKSGITH